MRSFLALALPTSFVMILQADLNEIRREVQALRSRGQGDGAHLTGNRGYVAN